MKGTLVNASISPPPLDTNILSMDYRRFDDIVISLYGIEVSKSDKVTVYKNGIYHLHVSLESDGYKVSVYIDDQFIYR